MRRSVDCQKLCCDSGSLSTWVLICNRPDGHSIVSEFNDNVNLVLFNFSFLASLVAVFGEFDISGDLEPKRSVTKNIKRVVVHREYDAATFENDLALLELESPIHYDTHIGKCQTINALNYLPAIISFRFRLWSFVSTYKNG